MSPPVISTILARVWAKSVCIPAWAPVRETAFTPREWRAIAVSAIVSCSPTARGMSISLSSGIEFSVFARAIKSFVTPLLAETTTITLCPSSTKVLILLATLRILSVLPTDVPPYFCTINDIFTPFIILAQKNQIFKRK